MNFRNQRLLAGYSRSLAIMSRVTAAHDSKGNHVKFACFEWLAVSEEAHSQEGGQVITKHENWTKAGKKLFADYLK